MNFKVFILFILIVLSKFVIAVNLDSPIIQNEQKAPIESGTDLPNAFRDLGYGIEHAYTEGRNGVFINLYTYHMTIDRHWPAPYVLGDNEATIGLGYARTYFNPKYNSEYSLGILGFFDTEYKPELHIGYTYLKYWDVTESKNFKVGLGYAPFIFVKPAWTNDAPIPLPGVSALGAMRFCDKVDVIVWYTGSLYFFNVRVDI